MAPHMESKERLLALGGDSKSWFAYSDNIKKNREKNTVLQNTVNSFLLFLFCLIM